MYNYVEDACQDFYALILKRKINIDSKDRAPVKNFANLISNQKPLTKRQGKFVLVLLKKYQHLAQAHDVDLNQILKEPAWKIPFREIDYSKRVWVEQEESGAWICLQFPFQLKDELDHTVGSSFLSDVFDKDRKVRMLLATEYNILAIDSFVQKHAFEKHSSYDALVSFVEEVQNNAENIVPHCVIENNCVKLKNVDAEVVEYFNKTRTNNLNADLLHAKNMGIPYGGSAEDIVQQVCTQRSDLVWLKRLDDFFKIAKQAAGTVVFLKDRTLDKKDWASDFLYTANRAGVHASDILIGFRGCIGFNNYIKSQGVTGKVDGQKYLVFEHKPPKWLFKENVDVTIVGTDVCYISNNRLLNNWLHSHPCVFYINEQNMRPNMGHFLESEATVAEL